MPGLRKSICFLIVLVLYSAAHCQQALNTASDFSLTILDENTKPATGAIVELLKNNKLVKAAITDAKGIVTFGKIEDGDYTFSITYTGYKPHSTEVYHFPSKINTVTIQLESASITLQGVSIVSKKPFIQQQPGKVVLNVDASVTNVGSTVLEVLEKSPGVTVDRNGGIALQGKQGVLVLIDDKPTYLSGADLNNLLSSMSSSQVEQIELMSNPSAKYDASGNAGIINIKTKKNKLKGFNGSFTVLGGQGSYPKNTDNLALNYRNGKVNTYFNYNVNLINYLTDLYALRKYYDTNHVITAMLDQPAFFSGSFLNNTFKTGLDYYVTPKTTLGIGLGGTFIYRNGINNGLARWQDAAGVTDSTISTENKSRSRFTNGAINLNARHTISSSQDISADIDWLHYSISNYQFFNNQLQTAGGYQELSRGNIPTAISIFSGKVDHTLKLNKKTTLQSGWKSSSTSTDNTAFYENFDGTQWTEDYSKSNHFIYKENITAFYSSIEKKDDGLSYQAGLRYENTGYKADQLGNALQKDSSFSRSYSGFFPSGYINYQADSSNSFTVTAGRRIDRPPFQTLNPFYFIVNKYTYSTGNPFLLPQYSWNLELNHQYKNLLSTSISYSIVKNYFSQLFLNDSAKGVLLYSQGNVGHTNTFGLSSTLTTPLFKWWSVTASAIYNHKELKGFNGNNYSSNINQLTININNQFSFAKVYTGEISGFYTTKARNDIQELLYPTGQLSLGVSRPVLKNKATLKLNARDIFHTNTMEGLTQFPNATEYFIIHRDSRVITLSFTFRFGKAYKAAKHSGGGAEDEIERVGNGG
ncbi:MAG TPA: TonB-dependent receptor family protein [Chitinophagaceae bacterium]|nr:TonB-dependent receptor family protein [Chitinophagaceae bacterium]